MSRDDDRLLELLGRLLAPESREPAPERVAQIRARAEAGRASYIVDKRRRTKGRVMAAAALIAVLCAFGAGVLAGESLPTQIREVAHSAGLPVDSVELVQARAALHDLGVALSRKDPDAARQADEEMLGLVEQLDEDEQQEIVPVAHEVHLRAVRFLRGETTG